MSAALRQELEKLNADRYDPEHGGWGFVHKYLDCGQRGVRAAPGQARATRPPSGARARRSRGSFSSIDPAWGGVYQYSDQRQLDAPALREDHVGAGRQPAPLRRSPGRDWRRARATCGRRARCAATCGLPAPPGGRLLHEPGRRPRAGRALPRPTSRWTTRSGAGRASRASTAPLRARERLGDRALAKMHAATGERRPRRRAAAARWALDQRPARRRLPHEPRHRRAYLADTLAMGALLALYAATGEREWLDQADAAARFIDARSGPDVRLRERRRAARADRAGAAHRREHRARALANLARALHRRRGARGDREARDAIPGDRGGRDGRPPRPACCSPTASSREADAPDGDRQRPTPRRSRALPDACLRVPATYNAGSTGGTATRARCRTRTSRTRSSSGRPRSSAPRGGARCPCSRRATWTPWPPDWAGRPAPCARARGRRRAQSARVDGTLTWPDPARDIRESPTARSSARAVHPNHRGG